MVRALNLQINPFRGVDHMAAQLITMGKLINKGAETNPLNDPFYGPFGPLDHSLPALLLVLGPFPDPVIPVFKALSRFAANLKYG